MRSLARKYCILVALLAAWLCISTTTASAAILLFDDFDGGGLGTGDGTSVNGGFTGFKNGATPNGYTTAEAPSVAELVSGPSGDDNNAGNAILSNSGFASADGVKATWVIADARFRDGTPENSDRVRLTISKSNTDFTSIHPESGSFQIEFDSAAKKVDIRIDNGTGLPGEPGADKVVNQANSLWDTGDEPSPMTVMAELDDDGFKVTLSTGPVFMDTWAPGVYDQFQDAGVSYISASIQGNGGSQANRTRLDVDSILVIGPDPPRQGNSAPEPTSLGLLTLAVGWMLGRRRRRARF